MWSVYGECYVKSRIHEWEKTCKIRLSEWCVFISHNNGALSLQRGRNTEVKKNNVLLRNSVAFQSMLLAVHIIREECPLLECVGYCNVCGALLWSPPDLRMWLWSSPGAAIHALQLQGQLRRGHVFSPPPPWSHSLFQELNTLNKTNPGLLSPQCLAFALQEQK